MDTYNGYKNYETWNVSLWLGNDESYYNITKNMKANELKEYVTSQFIMKGRKFGDLTKKIELNRVDWQEIAESLGE